MDVTNKKYRIGVCGVGSIGFRHARLLSQRNDVMLSLCDVVPDHLDRARNLSNLEKLTESFEEFLDLDLDGVIVATPDQFHIPQAEAACQKGIAVLIEKPIAENAEQIENLKRTVEKTNARVLVGYPLHYNQVFLKSKEILDSGAIGDPVSFHVMLGAYNTLISARNRFDDGARDKLFVDYSHEWDYINWFLGKVRRVAAISRQSGRLEKMQDPNVVNSILELESGVSGTAHLDYVQAPGQRSFRIIGDQGCLEIDAVRSTVVVKRYTDEFERVFRFDESFDQMMSRQLDHFIEVIGGRTAPNVSIADGLNAICVADAMIAACSQQTWSEVLS